MQSIIEIDLAPELQEYYELIQSEQFDFSDDLVVIHLLNTGQYTRNDVGIIMLLARRLEVLPEDSIFWSDKKCLINGAGLSIKHINQMKSLGYELGNGRVIDLQQSIGPVRSQLSHETQPNHANNEQDSQLSHETQTFNAPHFIPTISDLSMTRAENYLTKTVKAHIYKWMAIYVANHGDVKEMGKRLKKMIDEIVKEMS